MVDRDGDKVFDDLESRIAKADPTVKHRVIVTLKSPVTDERIAVLQTAAGRFAVLRPLPLVDGFSTSLTKGQVRALAKVGVVDKLATDALVHAVNETGEATFGVSKLRLDAPWLDGDVDNVQFDGGFTQPYSKDDIVAAVLDTGIDYFHSDVYLGGLKVIKAADFTTTPATFPVQSSDPYGHGTHVAATIAGTGVALDDRRERGVAPGAALVSVRVLDASGSGQTSWIIDGLNWVVTNRVTFGIEAVNMSLGESGCSDGTDPLSQAVNNAVNAGIVVVVAAGNEGPAACTIGSPGAAANAITVGATGDVREEGFYGGLSALELAYFSGRGPTAGATPRVKPEVVAPGVLVTSADAGTSSGYIDGSGTSMATAFVTGLALLLLEHNPAFAPTNVKGILQGTAIDRGPPGVDYEYGWGAVNAYAALQNAGVGSLTAPPTVPTYQYASGFLGGSGVVHDFFINVPNPNSMIGASLIMPGWACESCAPDFDLFLYGPAGNLLRTSDFVFRQEDVSYHTTQAGTYRVRVQSYPGGGGAGSFILELSQLGLIPPTNTVPPQLNGVVRVNDDISGTLGSWSGTPTPNVSGAVTRCDANGNFCFALTGADPASYTVDESNYGSTLRYRVTGHNFAGSVQAFSPVYRVLPYAPVNLDKPTVTWRRAPFVVPEVGDTLVAAAGRWRTLEPETHAFQFQQCSNYLENDCTNIRGADSSTFLLTPAQEGKRIRVADIATNSGGSATAYSFSTYEVAPPRSSPPRPSDPLPAPPPPTEPRPDPTPPPPPPGGTRPTTPMPDLVVSMTSDPPPGPIFGITQITYTIDINNASDVFATNALLTDVLPWNLTPVSATVNRPPLACSVNGQVVMCPLGDLPGRDSIRVVIVANVTSAVYTSNGASVTELQDDANPANNSAVITHS